MIAGGDNERSSELQDLINQDGNFVSREYSIMYREGEFGWVVSRAKVVTNSKFVRDNIDSAIAGRHWRKTLDNKWMIDVVEKGIIQEDDMGVDNDEFVNDESEVRQYLDDLSGK